jgi:Caspase domain
MPYLPALTFGVPHHPVRVCAVQMDRELSRSRAILISNAVFGDERIPDLPGVVGCSSAMDALLTSDLCGWPSGRVETLQDVATPPELARNLVGLTEGIQDVLLLYYAGHGMRVPNGQLALALRDTSSNRTLLRHTAMIYRDIADILRGCPAATKLVILDCCHAELGNRASDQFQSADIDAEPVDGLYCIWASKEWEKARSPLSGGLTYFTGAFVDVVRTGIPGKPSQLTIDQIFTELRTRLLRANLPEPAQSGIRDAHHWPFARNAAPQESHRDLGVEIASLTRRLAEFEGMKAVTDAKVMTLQAEVERLRAQASDADTIQERRELQSAIDTAERLLDETTVAETSAGPAVHPEASGPLPGGSPSPGGRRETGEAAPRVLISDDHVPQSSAEPPQWAEDSHPSVSHDETARRETAPPRAVSNGDTVPTVAAPGADSSESASTTSPRSPNGSLIRRRTTTRRPRRRRTVIMAAGSVAVFGAAAAAVALTLPGSPPRATIPPSPSTVSSHADGIPGSLRPTSAPSAVHAKTPTLAATITAPGDANVNYATFSIDGKFLAIGLGNGDQIYIWNAVTCKYVTTITIPNGDLSPVAFTQNDAVLIITNGNSIDQVNLSTGKRTTIRTMTGIDWEISGDGSTLVQEDSTGDGFYVSNLSPGSHSTYLPVPGNGAIVSVAGGDFFALDNDGGRLIVNEQDDKSYVLNTKTGHVLATFDYSYRPLYFVPALSPDGDTVEVFSNGSGPTTLQDVATRTNITPPDSRWPKSDLEGIFSADGRLNGFFSTDGGFFATDGSGNAVEVWNIATRSHIVTVRDPSAKDQGVAALGPDGSELVTYGLWNSFSATTKQLYLWKNL